MTPGSRRNTPISTASSGPVVIVIVIVALVVAAALAVTVTVALAVLAGTASPVGAQDHDGASLRIIDQTAFVAADGVLELVIDVDRPDRPGRTGGQLVLSVTFFGRLSDESEVDQPPTQPLNRLTAVALDEAERTEAGHLRLRLPIRSTASFDDQERVLLPEAGVYPITVELRDDEGPLTSVRTHLVRQPKSTDREPDRAEVRVSVLLYVSTAEGLTVAEATALLEAHPLVPMTLVLGHGVVNQLRGQPEATRALASALRDRPALTAPTIDLDPSALADIGQGDLYLRGAQADRTSLIELGLQPAAGVVLLSTPLTAAGLDVLGDLGTGIVLDVDAGFPTSGVLGPRGRATDVLQPDSTLTGILGDEGTAARRATGPYRAHRAVARLILRRAVDDSPVVIGGPGLGVDPAPALDAFLRALSQPGAPQPIPLSAVDGGPPLRLVERPQQDLTPVAELVSDLQAMLITYESFHLTGGTEPDGHRQQIVAALTRQRNPEDRRRALTVLADQLADELGVVEIHQPQPVNLAARSAPIPVVIDNFAPGPRQVLLRLRGDRVVSTEDERLLLIQPGTSSIDVEVEARSFGVSPLEVSVWTPDGSRELARARFEIRSTALPGLGLLVSLSAVGLLGSWWAIDHRKRRAGRRPVVDPDASPEPAGERVSN